MDYFFIFQFALKQQKLDYIQYTQLNPNSLLYQPQKIKFQNISQDFSNSGTNFKKMVQAILKNINDLANNFTNVTLVCQDSSLFTQIFPAQCKSKKISVPYVFTNFINFIQIVRYVYKCPYHDIIKIGHFLGIIESSKSQIIKKVLIKLCKDQKINDSDVRTIQQKSQKFGSKYQKPSEIMNFKHFKCIGLPFRIIQSQVLNHLAPQLPETHKQLYFIYQKDRPSGKALLKVPEFYQKQLMAKNKMYIGNRYVQIQKSTQEAFEQLKLSSKNYKSSALTLDRKQNKNFQSRDKFKKQQFSSLQNDRFKKSSNRQIQERRSRSRSHQKEKRKINVLSNNYDFLTLNQEEGIRIKGLPFSFTQWDVQNLFSFYNVIPGSVKMGHKQGTSIKNGDAVVLFRNRTDAQRGLQMNGFTLMNRYLQISLINKHQYDRYS